MNIGYVKHRVQEMNKGRNWLMTSIELHTATEDSKEQMIVPFTRSTYRWVGEGSPPSFAGDKLIITPN